MNTTGNSLLMMALLLPAGCAAEPAEPLSRSTAGSAVSGAMEFRLTKQASRFQIGSASREVTEFGMHKWVGDNGVFATRLASGMTLGSPNADSPSRYFGALAGGPDAHDKAVKDYFIAAGLPKGQISSVRVMVSGLLATKIDNPGDVQSDFSALYSYIERAVDGVPVVDSFAWASINEEEQVVTESVYWPSIPQAVIDSAKAFASSLADSTWAADFHKKAPPNGKLVIRHTPGVWDGTFKAAVAYDVRWANETLHFDATGTKFKMPNEKDGAWGETPSHSK